MVFLDYAAFLLSFAIAGLVFHFPLRVVVVGFASSKTLLKAESMDKYMAKEVEYRATVAELGDLMRKCEALPNVSMGTDVRRVLNALRASPFFQACPEFDNAWAASRNGTAAVRCSEFVSGREAWHSWCADGHSLLSILTSLDKKLKN